MKANGNRAVVRSFARERSEAARCTRDNHLLARQEVLAWWWARAVDGAWSILLPVATAGLVWYGGRRVLAGALTTGDLVMFIAYLGMLLAPLATLAASATTFQNSLAARVMAASERAAKSAQGPSRRFGEIEASEMT